MRPDRTNPHRMHHKILPYYVQFRKTVLTLLLPVADGNTASAVEQRNWQEGNKTYRVGMFGGAGANTMAQGWFDYDGCREDYRASLHRLLKEPVDVFIGNHVWNNDTAVKGELLLRTGENRFIDPQLWGQFLRFCEKRLDEVIAKDHP